MRCRCDQIRKTVLCDFEDAAKQVVIASKIKDGRHTRNADRDTDITESEWTAMGIADHDTDRRASQFAKTIAQSLSAGVWVKREQQGGFVAIFEITLIDTGIGAREAKTMGCNHHAFRDTGNGPAFLKDKLGNARVFAGDFSILERFNRRRDRR
jgi:hypothetical protein